ncbi:MAG: alkaline phosphatase family protein, partial [Thermodesulfobacteriota bacterium]
MRKIAVIFLILFAPLLFSIKASCEHTAKYALVITIDGLRPDAILKADAPNLKALIKEGSYTPVAKT